MSLLSIFSNLLCRNKSIYINTEQEMGNNSINDKQLSTPNFEEKYFFIKINRNENKSIQTSFIENNKKFERRSDSNVEDEKHNLIMKNNNLNNPNTKSSNSGVQTSNKNLVQPKPKINNYENNIQNEIRQKNIEDAMKNLENSPKIEKNINNFIRNLGSQKDSINKSQGNIDHDSRENQKQNPDNVSITDYNIKIGKDYFINNSKQERNKYILPDPDDIDDIIDDNIIDKNKETLHSNNLHNNVNKNNDLNNDFFYKITYSNTGSQKGKDSIADAIDFADEKINNFERIYNFD